MRTIYAVIKPDVTQYGDIADLALPFVGLYHMQAFEHISRYSLGHQATFFDTLEGAKHYIMPQYSSEGDANTQRFRNERRQEAVISLTYDERDMTVVSIDNIYTVLELKDALKQLGGHETIFEKVKIPTWNVRAVSPLELSDGALDEISKQLQLRYYADNNFSSRLALLVTTNNTRAEDKNRAENESKACADLGVKFDAEHSAARTATNDAASMFAKIIGFSLFVSGTVLSFAQSDISGLLQMARVAGVLSGGFGLGMSWYGGRLDNDKREFVRQGLFAEKNNRNGGEPRDAPVKRM